MTVMKRVLHLVSADCEWEAAAHIASLAAALRDTGWQSVVTAPEHSRMDEFAEAAGVEAAHYTLTSTLNPLVWRDLANLTKNSDISLLHAHDPDAAQMASRSGWFSSPGKIIVSRHELDSSIISAEYGSNVGAVICSSQAVEKAFKSSGKGDGKTHMIYDGVNADVPARAAEDRHDIKMQYRDMYCPNKEKPLFIVTISPLTMASGLAKLLEALPEVLAVLRQTHLVIMGEGPEKHELERQIRITALENDVTIVPPDRAYTRLQAAADVYVTLAENDMSGYMVQSAMAAARAVVAAKNGCYPELIEDDKNGAIIGGDDAAAIKDTLLQTLENRTRREHLGRMAQATAKKRMNIADSASKIADIYSQLCQ